MATDNLSDDKTNTISKKPYEKPSFQFEQVFVTTALSCGKLSGSTQGSCSLNPKVS